MPSRIIAAGYPTKAGPLEILSHCTIPKFFVHSTNDIYGPKADLEAAWATFAEPKSLQFIEAADHFFADKLDEFEETIRALPRVV